MAVPDPVAGKWGGRYTMKSRVNVCLIAALALWTSHGVMAATNTWDVLPGIAGAGNGAVDDGSGAWDLATGNWTKDGGLNNVVWISNVVDVAEFTGMSGGDVSVTESIAVGGIVFSGAGASSYAFSGVGSPTMTLGAGGITVKSAAGGQTLNNILSGNNALGVNGGGTLVLGGTNTFTGVMNFGDTSSGNTVYVTGKLTSGTAYSFNVGRNAFGNNTVDISGPGTAAAPTVLLSGNSSSFWVGGEGAPSSGNSVTIRNGAYFRANGGSGTTNSKMGSNAGSSNNTFTVTGVGSTLYHLGQRFYVGEYGSSNTLTVSAGGQVLLRVFHVGQGGNSNAVFVTGMGSYLSVTEDLLIGWNSPSSTNNTLTVSNGGSLYSQTRSGRTEISCNVGSNAGCNDNSLTITGAGSAWTNNGYNVVVGGTGAPASPVWQAASNNSIRIKSGGSAAINTGVILSGVNSSFNLGDGTNVSAAAIGSVRDGGVLLSVADARLNFNSGRLIANVSGTLVSGPGKVYLGGPAEVSVPATFESQIGSEIAGEGDLTAGGAGILTLTSTNTYTGETIVTNGVLRLTHVKCLDEKAVVRVVSPGTIDLAFAGQHKIKELIIDGVSMGPGIFGAGTPQLTSPDSRGFFITGLTGGTLIVR